jgi:hypothetical protein
MLEHETPAHGHHEQVGALFEETVNPVLKTAAQGELRAEDFVLGKNQEQHADSDAQSHQRPGIRILTVKFH